jgi:hypothetical protein
MIARSAHSFAIQAIEEKWETAIPRRRDPSEKTHGNDMPAMPKANLGQQTTVFDRRSRQEDFH